MLGRLLCWLGFHDYDGGWALNGFHVVRCRRCKHTHHRTY